MAKFFVDRPIFAIVIAILVMLAGALSIFSMPIEQYPTIAPPSIQITATYPGASAETVENTVVQVIEQQMSGLDHLLYLSSNADDSGQATTTLTFAAGTNPDIAQVQVQNKLQLATPLLPPQVQQTGIRVTKSSNGYLLAAGFVSSDNSMSRFDIANYIVSHLQDPLSRIDGVGNYIVFGGTQYAMRIWLDADKLNSFALTPVDVTTAIQNQNVQVAGGQPGGTASRVSVRHDPVREDFDRGSREDAVRGHRAGLPGDVPLPAEPPGYLDSDHRGAGRAPRNLRDHVGLRVHHQHAVDVRSGARDRVAGRRCDRRGRERRARDVRGRAVADRGDPQGHGADHRRVGRRRGSAERGVRPGGLLRRVGGSDLPAVLAHHRLGDAALGVRGLIAHARVVRHDVEAREQRRRGAEKGFLRCVQSYVRARARQVRGRCAPCHQSLRSLAAHLWCVDRCRRFALRAAAHRLPARRGSGHRVRAGAGAVG